MSSIRVVLGLAASLNLEIEQLDVKTAFLLGDLEEDIYMEQPEGFKVKGKEVYVCKLKKSLYGLKQAPRQWYCKFDSFIGEKGYKKTSYMKLCFGSDKPILVGYLDSDMAGDIDSRKSTSGYLITFAGGAVSLQSRLQKCVAFTTTESEFIAATEACKELLWIKRFVRQLGFTQKRYVLYCDTQSAIHLAKNSTFHAKSKHIDVRYHWIQDVLDAKFLELEKIHTDDNGSDMMTKALQRGKFETFHSISGMETTST
uniref:Reverse transcriptase Ty1/copia-type domain-containing protein n=1 Tax=Chenopodium quinoa TaxID=63459 RepID=A0A803N8D3_CHEQI